MEIKNNILETVGNTPLVKLNRVVPHNSIHQYLAKVEYFNPGGSVKDRIGISIIESAEKKGLIKPGGTIIEATSGNTGVGLALAAAIKGYRAIFIMPDKMSEEKINMLRAFGAKVVITPTNVEPEDPRSYYEVAKKMAEITPNSFCANQYHNPDNPLAHYETTGPEIWKQTDGKIDIFVAGAGTGGTLCGAAKFLKEKNQNIKVVGVDPIGSIITELFYTGKVTQKAQPYKIEGIGEDFLPSNYDFKVINDFIQVGDKESYHMCRELLYKEGLFVGSSSGAAVCGAIKHCEKIKTPQNIVVILPDNGNRYLSKAFNDAWMRENGLIDSPLALKTVENLIREMKPHQGIISVKTSHTVIDVIRTLKEKGISQVPVFSDNGNDLIGVIDESDLLYPLANGLIKTTDPILSFIRASILFVKLDEPLQKLADHFGKGFVALVKDRQDKLHILTKIDLIEYLGGNT